MNPSSPLSSTFYRDSIAIMSSHHEIQENPAFNGILDSERSGMLLNSEREDLCWDCLFMVCGGTGITPMLQLVSKWISLFLLKKTFLRFCN